MRNLNLKLFSLSLFALFGLSLNAAASDLADDLRTPFEPVTNPFGAAQARALPADVATALRALLESCAYVPTNTRSVIAVEDAATLRPGCETRIVASRVTGRHGEALIGPRLELREGALRLTAVSWDGSDSDGGDQQAIGIYDEAGTRVAVYPSLFADGNVIDGLALAVGAQLPKVEE